jgi:hypothetical protein
MPDAVPFQKVSGSGACPRQLQRVCVSFVAILGLAFIQSIQSIPELANQLTTLCIFGCRFWEDRWSLCGTGG